ncbi:MAG: ATP-binding protein [Thermoanaerobaculales bacterium]
MANTYPAATPTADLAEGKRRAFAVRVQRSRAMIYLGATGVLALAKLSGLVAISFWAIILLFAVAYLSALLFGALYRRAPVSWLGVPVQTCWMALDVAIITCTVWFAGGSASYWYVWYLANVTAAVFVAGRRAAVVTMIANIVAYAGLVIATEPMSARLLTEVVGKMVLLYGAAFFALLGISDLRAKRRTIAALREQERERTAELAESEERFRRLFERAPTPYFLVDAGTGALLEVNGAAESLCQRARPELVGRSVGELGLGWLVTAVARTPANHEVSSETLAAFHDTSAGQQREVEVRSHRTISQGRDCIFVAAEDVTDRRRIEHERERANRLESLGLVAGGIAHDFNNILAAAMGNLSLARLRLIEGSEASDRMLAADAALGRAKHLTGQLLTFSKGGAPIRAVSDVAALIRESASLVHAGSRSRCECRLDGGLWLAEVDPGQIRQVISSVVINADQAMPDGGHIVIHAQNLRIGAAGPLPLAPGPYLKVTVSDTGPGIPADIRDRVFDPYFTTKPTGTGLGLTTAYGIVKNHGGHIAVDATAEGGAEVTIYLPASPEATALAANSAATLRPASGRLLVMDDESAIRGVYLQVLTELGYEAEAVPDGEQAVRRYLDALSDGHPFAAVITDLTVPGGMGGRETVAELRRHDPSVRAIVASGYSDDPVLADFGRFGFAAALTKPFTMDELARTLAKLLQPADREE